MERKVSDLFDSIRNQCALCGAQDDLENGITIRPCPFGVVLCNTCEQFSPECSYNTATEQCTHTCQRTLMKRAVDTASLLVAGSSKDALQLFLSQFQPDVIVQDEDIQPHRVQPHSEKLYRGKFIQEKVRKPDSIGIDLPFNPIEVLMSSLDKQKKGQQDQKKRTTYKKKGLNKTQQKGKNFSKKGRQYY
jgi:hypothetical protein